MIPYTASVVLCHTLTQISVCADDDFFSRSQPVPARAMHLLSLIDKSPKIKPPVEWIEAPSRRARPIHTAGAGHFVYAHQATGANAKQQREQRQALRPDGISLERYTKRERAHTSPTK